jgi:hypothetical protein
VKKNPSSGNIVLVILLLLAGRVSYISFSATDSLIHSPHEKALEITKK